MLKLSLFARSLVHVHSFARLLFHSFARSLVRSCARALVRPFACSFVRPFAHSLVRSFTRSLQRSLLRLSAQSHCLYSKHNKTELNSLFCLHRTVALIFFFFQFAEQDRSKSFLACGNYENTSSAGHQGEGKTRCFRGRYPNFIPRSGVCQYGALTLPWSKKVCFCFYLKVKSVCKFCQKLSQIKPATLC